MRTLAACAALAGLAFLASQAHADETIHVPGDHATIQAAVDQAQQGDTIRIARGTYLETVVIFEKDGITLVGSGRVVIDAQGITAGSAAVEVLDSTGVVLDKLIVANAIGNGVQVVDSTNCTVRRCFLADNAGHAVQVRGGNGHTIEKCRMTGNTEDGADVTDSAGIFPTNCTVSKNKIEGGDDGICITGDGHTVTKNKIRNTGEHGIRTTSDTTNVTFEKNKLKDAGGLGFFLRGTSNTLFKNVVVGADTGVLVIGDGHTLTKDKFAGMTEDGVRLDPASTNATVTKVKIKQTRDDGVEVNGATHMLERVAVKKTLVNGFYFRTGGHTLRRSKVKKTGAFDLRDDAGPNANTYEDNKLDPNKTQFGP